MISLTKREAAKKPDNFMEENGQNGVVGPKIKNFRERE